MDYPTDMEDFSALLASIKERFIERIQKSKKRSDKVEIAKASSQHLYEVLIAFNKEFIKREKNKPPAWGQLIDKFFNEKGKKPLLDSERRDLQRNLGVLRNLIEFRHSSTHETSEVEKAKELLKTSCDSVVQLLKVFSDRGFGSEYFPKILKRIGEPAQRVLWLRFWRAVLQADFQPEQESRILSVSKEIVHLQKFFLRKNPAGIKDLACAAIHDFPDSQDYLICLILENPSIYANLPADVSSIKTSDVYKRLKADFSNTESQDLLCSNIKLLMDITGESEWLSVFEASVIESITGEPTSEDPESVFSDLGSLGHETVSHFSKRHPLSAEESFTSRQYGFLNMFWRYVFGKAEDLPFDLRLYVSIRAMSELNDWLDNTFTMRLGISFKEEPRIDSRQKRVLDKLLSWFLETYRDILGADCTSWRLDQVLATDIKSKVTDAVLSEKKVHYWDRLFVKLEPRTRLY